VVQPQFARSRINLEAIRVAARKAVFSDDFFEACRIMEEGIEPLVVRPVWQVFGIEDRKPAPLARHSAELRSCFEKRDVRQPSPIASAHVAVNRGPHAHQR